MTLLIENISRLYGPVTALIQQAMSSKAKESVLTVDFNLNANRFEYFRRIEIIVTIRMSRL